MMSIDEMILELDFKEGPDSKLVSRTQIVLIRTKGVTAYSPVSAGVTLVEGYYHDFIVAVSDALNGGTEAINIRVEKRGILEDGLEKLGNSIILNSGGDPLYVTNANFKLRSNESEHSRTPLADPLWKDLNRGVLTGTLRGSVKNMPKGARGLLVQWRPAGTVDYFPSNPSNGKRIELSDLPTNTKVEVQVRFFGTYGRLSNWSIPFPIDVV